MRAWRQAKVVAASSHSTSRCGALVIGRFLALASRPYGSHAILSLNTSLLKGSAPAEILARSGRTRMMRMLDDQPFSGSLAG